MAHRTADAARFIGPLVPGVHITGVTAGQFSSIDAVEHIANQLGPCHAWISTWTTGLYDTKRAAVLAENGNLLGVRMLLDRGTFEKSPQYAGPLIAALGEHAFRCMAVHAKVNVFVGREGEPLAVMRSSMNLNKNLRTEQLDISVCPKVAGFYAEWFDALWDECGVSQDNVAIVRAVYDRWTDLVEAEADEAPAPALEEADADDLGSLALDWPDA